LLTITDLNCCTTDEPQKIPIRKFRKRLRPRVEGLNYVGMIEPAFYVNLCQGARYKGRRAVSWHAHLIVWGVSTSELKRLVAEWNSEGVYQSIADGIPAAHREEINPRTFSTAVCYTLKSPANGYRLRKREVITEHGEIVSKFTQWKQRLRPGERVRLFHLTKHLYLDQMSLAGGRGVSLLRGIKKLALRRYRRYAANCARQPTARPGRRGQKEEDALAASLQLANSDPDLGMGLARKRVLGVRSWEH
jgi:hypothetical protein